jgi:Secretion system C-terminal sorting domain
MKNKLFILGFLINAVVMQAQQVITTAGNYSSGTSGSLSWTLGEEVIDTYTGTNVILTQGFQQSKLSVTAIQELLGSLPEISAYPNPANDFILLKITSESVNNFKYQLYDLYGKLLAEQKLANSETRISFSNLASGTYLLKVFNKDRELKVFKIINNKY